MKMVDLVSGMGFVAFIALLSKAAYIVLVGN